MDKDSYMLFEAYKSIFNENVPVELMGGYGGTGEEVTASFPELSRGKYDLSPEETKQVFSNFIKKFKELGGKSPKLYKDFYESEIAPIVRQTKPSINNTNSKYTSRVLYNALKEAKVISDERDGVSLDKRPSVEGVAKLTKYTFKNAEKLGTEAEEPEEDSFTGLDDLTLKRFYEKILGEGEYSRKELVTMYQEDNPDIDDSDAVLKISDMIMSGYLKKTDSGNYVAVDPDEQGENREEKEGEGTGEVTSGLEDDEIEDFDRDPWGGVYVGPRRGEGGMD